MATKKDLDDILNNSKSKKNSAKRQSSATSKQRIKSNADNMSVDDVINSFGDRKSAGIKSDAPKKLAPLTPKKSASNVKPASAENKSKKRIVITGELPDYDALRERELEKDRQEKINTKKRLEAEQKAKEEAERKRLEAEKKAREEAERKRLEAEKKAREEAERKRLEAEKKVREEAERKRLEAERKTREEAERKRLEAEKKAREEAERKRLEAEKKAREEAERKRLEAEKKAREEAERKRLEAEETKRRLLEEAEEFTVEEITEISTSEEYDDDYDEYEEFNVFNNSDDESDPVGSLIDNIREDAEKAFADIENNGNDDEYDYDDESDDEYSDDEEYEDDDTTDESEKTSSGISSALENILDEDVDEIINERSEKAESDRPRKPKLKLKKNIYTFLGLIFAVFACVGLVTIVSKGISLIGGFSSGNSKKSGFEPVVYPVVIMDIESFETPAELSSEQVITAAIWSMIMSDDAIGNYEQTFDVVKIPAVDVESYAVKLFGENLPALNHTTVGPAESRFYYNEETKSYNVPIAPVTYTYSPEIKGATKHDNTYTIVVDYIDELPEWLPKKSSKSVEFKLTETNDGYTIDSMKVLSTSRNSL